MSRRRRASHGGSEAAELEHRAVLELGSRVWRGRPELRLGIYGLARLGAHIIGWDVDGTDTDTTEEHTSRTTRGRGDADRRAYTVGDRRTGGTLAAAAAWLGHRLGRSG